MNNSIPQGSINEISNNSVNNNENDSAALLNNRDDLNTTETDLEDERLQLERQQNELNKTNLFKTRVIESEINSSLLFQISLYYNFYYAFLCFVLQLLSVSYKCYVFKKDDYTYIRIIFVICWIVVEIVRIYLGYLGNIQESVSILSYNGF